MSQLRPTYRQKLFADEQLSLGSHDQIVRWVDVSLKTRLPMVLDAIGLDSQTNVRGEPCLWSSARYADVRCARSISNVTEYAIKELARHLAPELPDPPPARCTRVNWEPILKNERGGILGALDLLAEIEIPEPTLKIQVEPIERSQLERVWNLPEWQNRSGDTLFGSGKSVWFRNDKTALNVDADVASAMDRAIVSPTGNYRIVSSDWFHESDYQKVMIVIEAKTEIRSAGELLRQLNLYRDALPKAHMLVVAPASAWHSELQTILREQGIHTLTYLANG